MTCSSDCNNLLTATFAILGTFNYTWQVEKLNFCAFLEVTFLSKVKNIAISDRSFVANDTRHSSERGKLIGGDFGVDTGQVGQERRLADGRKSDEAHTGVTSSGDVKTLALATSTATRLWFDNFTTEFCQFRLQQTQMARSCLIRSL